MITDPCPLMTERSAPAARRVLPSKPRVPQRGVESNPAAESIDPRGDFIVRLYLRDLARAQPADTAPAGREQLVFGQLSRVVRLAFDYQGFGLPLGDLINEGNLGLLRAAELFDPARHVRFGYYAKPWIRVQMQRALSYQSRPVSLPADFAWRHGQVLGAEERLTAALDRPPKDAELAHECQLGLPAIRRLRSTPAPTFVPLETPCPGAESGLTLDEVIPDETVPAPDREAIRGSDREYLAGLLTALSAAEKRVIRLRYGLTDGEPRTLEEVGRSVGCGRQVVHRLEKAALTKMRAQAGRAPSVSQREISALCGRGSPSTARV